MERLEVSGFIVHAQVSPRDGRAYLCGRLEDGRSFAVADSRWFQSLVVSASERERTLSILSSSPALSPRGEEAAEEFSGRPASRLRFSRADFPLAAERLSVAGIACLEADLKAKDAYLLDLATRGGIRISGDARPGRRVDLVFSDPGLSAAEVRPRLKWAAFDLETAPSGELRAASLAWGPAEDQSVVYVVPPPGRAVEASPGLEPLPDEASLIRALSERIVALDPDVLTGWNVIDFDFRALASRCAARGIPFDLGRSAESSRFLDGSNGGSASVIVPGRQCVDALRAARSGGERYPDLSLETVSRAVLGEGKDVAERGEAKLAELERLYHEEPEAFARYCAKDSLLVLRILEKTGLGELTAMRAALTGVSLDRAWTSIGPFERLYALGLRGRGVALPPEPPEGDYGSPGGLILEPSPGLFREVHVLDFKSLYPTLIRSFNIDPLAHARSGSGDDIVAPNGARFSRAAGLCPGILPRAIAEYFAKREEARAGGDRIGVHVYKILMNSFYGVLGARGCRYARRALAGAVTGFGQKYLSWTRDWLEAQGYRVLYGDTDSAFVQERERGSATLPPEALTASLNAAIAQAIRAEYGLPSYLEIKLEKTYDRFFIPRIRYAHDEDDEARGRAKGYAGRIEGTGEVEVKGMEAARSDWTPLARRFQVELLSLLFSDADETALKARVDAEARAIRAGERDAELVFSRRLRRPPDAYVKNEPPHVKAARMLGWTDRRGTVDYLVTIDGPQPLSLRSSPIDYGYYVDRQLLPMVRSIAESAGLDIVPREAGSGQLELGL